MPTPTEIRTDYITKLQFRDQLATAIQASQDASNLQTNLIKWASPTFVRDAGGGLKRVFSDKFLAYCSDPRYATYTKGKTPLEISVAKINEAHSIIKFEADNRKMLRVDLATVEAELADLRLQLPPDEQVMSLDQLMALQPDADSRYAATQGGKLADAATTQTEGDEAVAAAVEAALQQ